MGGAVVSAATVQSWPTVAALALVLVCSLIWVALGPTVSSSEVELPDGMIIRQHQLTFARRAPLPGIWRTKGSLETRTEPRSSVRMTSHRVAESGPSTAEIRAWAREQGQAVNGYGPLSADVRRAWDQAQSRHELGIPPTKKGRELRGL